MVKNLSHNWRIGAIELQLNENQNKMNANEILKKHEDANEMHFHEVDRKRIIEAMDKYYQAKLKLLGIADVNIPLRYKLIANAINGIMANPNTAPTQQVHFDNIAEDAIRIADTILNRLNNE